MKTPIVRHYALYVILFSRDSHSLEFIKERSYSFVGNSLDRLPTRKFLERRAYRVRLE